MKRRQGQAMVEFALIAPMLFLMIFGMIWAGFMFIQYLHFSNEVRTVARQIAVTSPSERNDDLRRTKKEALENFYNTSDMPKVYEPTAEISYTGTAQTGDVKVKVTLTMPLDVYNSLPRILQEKTDDIPYGVGFPPKTIRIIEYSMKLEGSTT